ncbi:hypothetical protein [Enterobacter kobei]|uniref:hypothetical protein n=1 Tax=Enterobacter kobei TaxID=208224 RepID=UPI0006825F8E|nr:hypothetical protein [Enterobacter kobei]
MIRNVEVRSIREGVYILWYLGYTDLASLYASGSERELLRFNGAINRLIEQVLTENDKSEIVLNFIKNQEMYRKYRVDETIASWFSHDEKSSVFFWLYLLKKFRDQQFVDEILSFAGNSYHDKKTVRDKNNSKVIVNELPIRTPDNPKKCFMAGLYILDLLSFSPDKLQRTLDEIKIDYSHIRDLRRKDFAWFTDAGPEDVKWVWKQFNGHPKLLNKIIKWDLSESLLSQAIPLLYYLWDEREDTKALYLNTLRKRYANMKHRRKVANKAPVNIRISENAKKTLVKLEKRFNRNRADVIEYLIEKTWQELNQKN